MANEVTMTKSCNACNGTGIDTHTVPDGQGGSTVVEQDCAACSATGKVQVGVIAGGYFDDVLDLLADLQVKVLANKEVIDEIKAVVDAL